MATQILPGVVMNSPGGNDNEILALSAAPQALTAATEAVITGSQIVLPVGGLQVGARFKWTLSMTKTAAGTGTTNILVKTNTTTTLQTGTAGTAATLATLAGDTETAAADTAVWVIEVVITAVSLAAGTAKLTMFAQNALAATGFFSVGVRAQSQAITGKNTSASVLAIGLAVTTGAADVVTVNFCECEADCITATGAGL